MKKQKKLSSVLIGSYGDNSNKFSQFLLGRKQELSKPLIGHLKDSDRDGYPDISDCNPSNSKEHAIFNPINAIKELLRKKPGITYNLNTGEAYESGSKPETVNVSPVIPGTRVTVTPNPPSSSSNSNSSSSSNSKSSSSRSSNSRSSNSRSSSSTTPTYNTQNTSSAFPTIDRTQQQALSNQEKVLQDYQKRQNQAIENIRRMEAQNIANNKWTSSKKSYNQYMAQVEAYNKSLEEYQKRIDTYNAGVNWVNENIPSEKRINIKTGEVYEEPIKIGKYEVDSNPKIYVDESGKPIEDIQQYLQKNKIGIETNKVFNKDKLFQTPTYDLKGLYFNHKLPREGIKVNGKWIPSASAMGTVSPVTAEDIWSVYSVPTSISKVGIKSALQIGFSKQISGTTSSAIDKIIPVQNTGFSLYGAPKQVVRGGLYLASSPIAGFSFATEIGKSAVENPVETATSLKEYAVKNPYEIATLTLYPKIKQYSPKVRTLEIPTESGAYKVRLFGFETKRGRSINLASYSKEGGLKVGTPNVSDLLTNLPSTTEIKIGSALETSTISKSLRSGNLEVTPRAKEIIPIAQDILRRTQNTKSKFINKDLLYSSTERLPKEAVKQILSLGTEEQGILFGSKSRAFQLAQEYTIAGKKYELNKIPRDIELRFDKSSEIKLQEITNKAIERLKKIGKVEENGKTFDLSTAREIKDTPYAIEAKVNGKWEKVIELKGKGSTIEGEEVPEFVAGFKKTGKTMKIDNTIATRLNEELRGVSQGVLRVRQSGGIFDIFPSPKRMKDIGSVSVSARTLSMSKLNPLSRAKLQNSITKFESLFPEELVREQVKSSLNEKVQLTETRVSSPTRGFTSYSVYSASNTAVNNPLYSGGYNSDNSLYGNSISSVSISPKSTSPSVSVSSLLSPSVSPSPKTTSPSMSSIPSISPSPSMSPSRTSSSSSPSSSVVKSPSRSTSPYVIPSLSFPGEPLPVQKIKVKQDNKPYDAYVLKDATKGRKARWIKVADNVDRLTALSVGADITDRTISSQFKIVPDKGNINEEVKSNKWKMLGGRFREYMVRKGNKIQRTNKFIEKAKYRLNDAGEVRRIQSERKASARSLLIGGR